MVDLSDGRVDSFFEGAERPSEGYYAEFDSLERYCDRHGARLLETNGQASAQPVEDGRAG